MMKVDAGSRRRSLRQSGARAPGGPWSFFPGVVFLSGWLLIVGRWSSISGIKKESRHGIFGC